MPLLADPRRLADAARKCMRRASAPGSDGMSWFQYRQGFRGRLEDLAARLHTGVWEPGPLREVALTSYTGKTFQAVIPTVEDRVVHRAMRTILDLILDRDILPEWVSGYRPGRNRITALRLVDAFQATGLRWVADVDVAAASAGGDAGQLTDWLAVHVQDGSFLRLFRRAVAGLPAPVVPGSGLWPVLFQLRMAQVDAQLAGLSVVRFADNYVACADSQADASAAMATIMAALKAVGLQPNASKSRVREPRSAHPEDLFLIAG
jgi:RNA-directed DNA polymerase